MPAPSRKPPAPRKAAAAPLPSGKAPSPPKQPEKSAAPLPDDPERHVDLATRTLTYIQPVPPEIDDPQLQDFLRRWDALSVGRGPPASELVVIDGLPATPEEQWMRMRGWTPFEFLTHVYRQPFVSLNLRIRAAESLLAYAHQQKPKRIDATIDNGTGADGVVNIGDNIVDLKQLSDKDLLSIEGVLKKAKGKL